MKDDRLTELDLKVEQLKKSYPEMYLWIELKEKQRFFKKELSSDNPSKNCDENREELKKVEEYMEYMRNKYSSIMLYEAISKEREMLSEKL